MSKKYLILSFILITFVLQSCGSDKNPEVPVTQNDTQEAVMENETATPSAEEGTTESMADLEGAWNLNTAESTLTWSSSRVVGSDHSGTVDLKSGSLAFESQALTSGEFVIDMTTIKDKDNNARLIEHISGEDFFAVATYPEAKLVITDVKREAETAEGTKYEVTADLTIRGITHPIVFYAMAKGDADRLNIVADFTIDRTRWGITFDSSSFFTNLGDKAIKDLIQFQLDLTFGLLN